MSDGGWNNPWKLTAIGMGLVMVTALVTGIVVGGLPSRSDDRITPEVKAPEARPAEAKQVAPAPAPRVAAVPQAPPAASPRTEVAPPAPAPATARPPASTIESCNRIAASAPSTKDKTMEVVKDSAVAGLVGAAVGAAGGAIAGGGSGAGKGAGIGGVVGLGAGALYGLNENRKNDEKYREAYAACMRKNGYGG